MSEGGPSEVVELLRAMVGARSENPPGDETAIQDVVRRYLEAIPEIELEVIEAAARRPIIVATLRGGRPGRTLLFGGHIDTVPAGHQWTRDPFGGEVIDGRLYGLGSSDMKGGVAGFLVAMKRLAGTSFAGTVVAHIVPDEEPGGQLGAMILLERGYLRGDAAVIAEPSELCVFRAQKGNVFASLRTEGRSAHGSMPENGVNAISKAVRLAYDLEERFAPTLAARRHELVGHATVSIGTIHGGARTNVVPDECVVTIDRRVVPGELPEDVLSEIERFVDGRAAVSYDFVGAAFDTPVDHWLVRAAIDVVNSVHGRAMPVGGLVGSSDARFYASDAGIPTIILGPGAMIRAHVPDEWVDVRLLESSVEVYERLARAILTEGDGSDE